MGEIGDLDTAGNSYVKSLTISSKMKENSASKNLAMTDLVITRNPQPSSCGPQDALKPTTFHRFSDLPQELQNLIWGFVEIEPRLIIEKQGSRGVCFGAPYGAPAILHVSSKARAEGLKRFPRLIASGTGPETKYYHVNFRNDIIFAGYGSFIRPTISVWGSGLHWTISDKKEFKSVRTVAVGTDIDDLGHYGNVIEPRFAIPALADELLHILAPYLNAKNGALEEILVVPMDESWRMGEMGFMSLEKEALRIEDFVAYGSKRFPQLLPSLIEKTKRDF